MVYGGLLARTGISPGHLLIASFLSLFSGILIAKIMVLGSSTERAQGPITVEGNSTVAANWMDATCRGAGDGMHLTLSIMAMLIAFAALIAFGNLPLGTLGEFGGEALTLQRIFAFFFAPIACGCCGFRGRNAVMQGSF